MINRNETSVLKRFVVFVFEHLDLILVLAIAFLLIGGVIKLSIEIGLVIAIIGIAVLGLLVPKTVAGPDPRGSRMRQITIDVSAAIVAALTIAALTSVSFRVVWKIATENS